MNSINIIGRLVRDPESRATTSGSQMTTFAIACDDGKDEVSYYDCKAFEKTAELVAKYKRKGDQVAVSGRLKQERWEKDGQKRSAVRIIAGRVDFIGPRAEAKPDAAPAAPVPDDDIPF